jgi:hypothetical protein
VFAEVAGSLFDTLSQGELGLPCRAPCWYHKKRQVDLLLDEFLETGYQHAEKDIFSHAA